MSQFVNANGNTLLNLKFSLEERETGMQWIDCIKIYCKVMLVSGFDSEDKYVPHNNQDHDGISIQVTKKNLILQVGQSNGFADATGYAILKYTKSK